MKQTNKQTSNDKNLKLLNEWLISVYKSYLFIFIAWQHIPKHVEMNLWDDWCGQFVKCCFYIQFEFFNGYTFSSFFQNRLSNIWDDIFTALYFQSKRNQFFFCKKWIYVRVVNKHDKNNIFWFVHFQCIFHIIIDSMIIIFRITIESWFELFWVKALLYPDHTQQCYDNWQPMISI